MTLKEKRIELGIEEIYWHGQNTGMSDDEILAIETNMQKFDKEHKKLRYTITFEATVNKSMTCAAFKAMIKSDVQFSNRALKAIVNEEIIEL
jgi:hypothetical protein